jgi:tetratricopeptide (TPR) repeat protein
MRGILAGGSGRLRSFAGSFSIVTEGEIRYSLKDPATLQISGVAMEDEAQQKTPPTKRIMGWVGTASALIGFGASIAGGVHWLENRHQHRAEFASQMAAAEEQAKQGEYQASVQSYNNILKDNPLDPSALKQQLDATMQWVENFHVVGREGQDAASAAAPQLDEIMAVLDAGLTRSKGSEAADVQAHIGWVHWLNRHMAEREFGPAAEQNLQAALKLDPSNVYANAMLGNWVLQTNGNFTQAIGYLRAAVATGKVRPYVRRMQLGGLIDDEASGARAELFKVANEMRVGGESLDADRKRRILTFCCNPTLTDHAELVESLSVVPKDDAWKTYLWLDDSGQEGKDETVQRLTHEFINATLLEISGDRPEALKKYRQLQQELSRLPGSLKDSVDGAIVRLSHN